MSLFTYLNIKVYYLILSWYAYNDDNDNDDDNDNGNDDDDDDVNDGILLTFGTSIYEQLHRLAWVGQSRYM